jgi:RHS repeat-associated protein
MVANDKEYSKHYYIEEQRIASKLGGGMMYNLHDLNTPVDLLHSKIEELPSEIYQMLNRDFECVNILPEYVTYDPQNFDGVLNNLTGNDNPETELYFYHSDHLGSSSFITDASGISTQHLQYLPFGESFVEQSWGANYFTPYKFSVKEKDEETGYSYFGARYLATDFSIWLSVDPLADKYPNISPYAYCAWNPVMLVDPDGNELTITGEASDKAVSQLKNIAPNLKLRNENGVIKADGKAKTPAEKQLIKIINDTKIKVNITAKNTNKIDSENETNQYGGGYLGNTVKKDENDKVTSVDANQFVNPDVIAYWDEKTESTVGEGMMHEVIEAFAGGVIAKETGDPSPGSNYKNSTYDQAHRFANKYSPGDIQAEVHYSSKPVSFKTSRNILGYLHFEPVYTFIKFRKVGNY